MLLLPPLPLLPWCRLEVSFGGGSGRDSRELSCIDDDRPSEELLDSRL